MRIFLYVLIGAPGSGKTTWAIHHAPVLNASIVSTDAIRNSRHEERISPRSRDMVYIEAAIAVQNHLSEGRNVIIDGTNAKRQWRAHYLAIGRQQGVRCIGVWLDKELSVCVENNFRRQGQDYGKRTISESRLTDIYMSLEVPTREEFDEIWRIS